MQLGIGIPCSNMRLENGVLYGNIQLGNGIPYVKIIPQLRISVPYVVAWFHLCWDMCKIERVFFRRLPIWWCLLLEKLFVALCYFPIFNKERFVSFTIVVGLWPWVLQASCFGNDSWLHLEWQLCFLVIWTFTFQTSSLNVCTQYDLSMADLTFNLTFLSAFDKLTRSNCESCNQLC